MALVIRSVAYRAALLLGCARLHVIRHVLALSFLSGFLVHWFV